MGKHAPSNRENELRVEKLFLRRGLVGKFGSGKPLGLEDFASFVWHEHPCQISEFTVDFLRELIAYRRLGRPYTQDDWVRFSGQCGNSKSSRLLMLEKLAYLGFVEKRNKTKMQYEIRLSDKWIQVLEYLALSWVWVCENDTKVRR